MCKILYWRAYRDKTMNYFYKFSKTGGINTSTIQPISWEGNRWNNGHGKDNRRKYKQQLTGIVF